MIKRLLSFFRHMNEPVWEDPKASRWADLYQKRARFTGQLPEEEMLRKMGLPADNPFWKEDNADPSAGFAVNTDCRVDDVLRADSAENLKVEAIDDFGKAIHKLPLSKTSSSFYFHINFAYSAFILFPLNGAKPSIEMNDFIWEVARVFRDFPQRVEAAEIELEEEDDEEVETPRDFNPSDHIIRRIAWDKSRNGWCVFTAETRG